VDGASTRIWKDVSQRLIARMGETGSIRFEISKKESGSVINIVVPIEQWMNESTAPDPLRELGIIEIEIPAIVGEVFEGGAADEAGLLEQDKIIRVNGLEIRGWAHWVEVIRASSELETLVVVEREGRLQTIVIIPERKLLGDGVYIGVIGAASAITNFDQIVSEEMRREVSYSLVEGVVPAITDTWDKAVFILGSVQKMVVGLISIKNVNGPITIAQVAGNTASYGLDVYLQFLGLLSVSLGVMNLLPIPVLDGGRLLFIFLEVITGSPLPERIQAYGMQIGVMLISGIMLLAVFNDVNRLL
jgi:regulator of sigma E protease